MSTNQSLLCQLERDVLSQLQNERATGNLSVAYSGGIDSTVLLYICWRLNQAKKITRLKAIHVNHGLQESADKWALHCRQECDRLAIPLLSLTASLDPKIDANVESAAREARYKCFEETIQSGEALLFGHHQDDQAETVLFRLLRGAGLNGATGIPLRRRVGEGFIVRPLLNHSRAEIESYAKQHQLNWVEDPTNQSTAFTRNYLRHQVMPVIAKKWPNYATTLSRFSQLADEQNQLLESIARDDLLNVAVQKNRLDCYGLSTLNNARQKNLLHYWGKTQGDFAPSNRQIQQVTSQLFAARKGASIVIDFAGKKVRSFAGHLFLVEAEEPSQLNSVHCWKNFNIKENPSIKLDNGVTIFAVAFEQKMLASQKNQSDLPNATYPKTSVSELSVGIRPPKMDEPVSIRARPSGAKVCPHYRQHNTSLKNIYQELNIPPWERDWLPVIFYGENIVGVPGVFVAKNFIADSQQSGIIFKLADSQK